MATGKAPASTPSSTVRGVVRSAADGWRYYRTHEPEFIAGVAPVSLYAVAADVTDPTSAWSLFVGATSVAGSLRYYGSSDHARRNRAMRTIAKALVEFKLTEPSGAAPRMKNLVVTPAGKRVDIRVPKQSAAMVFEKFAPALEDKLGAQIRFEQIPAPRFGPVAALSSVSGKVKARKLDPVTQSGPVRALIPRGGVRMHVVERDTLATPLTTTWPVLVPGPDGEIPARRWWNPVPVMTDEDGERVEFSWETTPSLLIAGESGAGKSVGTHELVSAWTLDPTSGLLLWDGKGELELTDYAPLALDIAGPDPERAVVLGMRAVAELERRLGLLKDLGLKKAPRDHPDFPPLKLVVEEFTAYAKNHEFIALLQYLLVRIRAVNMRMVLTTQRPSSKVIDTDIRDNVSARWAHRMNTHSSSDMCLGPGWASNGWSAMSIPAGDTHKGVGLLLHDGGAPRKGRSWYSGDDMPARVVARAMRLRGMDPRAVPGGTAAFLSAAPHVAAVPAPREPAPVAVTATTAPRPVAVEPVVDPDTARKAHDRQAFAARTGGKRRRPSRVERNLHPVPTAPDEES